MNRRWTAHSLVDSRLRAGSLHRKTFLAAAGTTLALPRLEADGRPASGNPAHARNFVAVGTYLGWHQDAFFPKLAGRNYELTPTLTPLARRRDDFTIFSGLDHRAPHGHGNWPNFLCGQTPKTYSFDQMIADRIGNQSRFPSLQLIAGAGEAGENRGISFTAQGIALPMIQRPTVLYRKLFATDEDRARTEHNIRSGRSALDHVVEDARRLEKGLPQHDREKLGEYFSSLRAVERRLQRKLEQLHAPAFEPDYPAPSFDPITPNLQIEAEEILYDLIVLALESGSTRVATLFLDGLGQVFTFDGRRLRSGYHGLSHHGNDPEMIDDLVAVETAHIRALAGFLDQLKTKKGTDGGSLLDETIVLVGTGMGDASRHSNHNLPTIVAGGGFRHGQHLRTDTSKPNSHLLGDLYLTLSEKLGLEMSSFSNASHTMNEIFPV